MIVESLAVQDFLNFKNYYLVGIKGVAMTALAACLRDAGKAVAGVDVAENFVTASQLRAADIDVTTDFTLPLPESAEVIIYSGAHGGRTNPLVQAALARDLPVYSHAQAQAALFSSQQGWAVCGANGKSTVSAMLAFILTQLGEPVSYSVGVGEIKGLARTGSWQTANSQAIFIAEADEYVEDITQLNKDTGRIVPRFSYLRPQVIIANNLSWDHPDVYRDLSHTQEVFGEFFMQLPLGGILIANRDDVSLWQAVEKIRPQRPDLKIICFGKHLTSNLLFDKTELGDGCAKTNLTWNPPTFMANTLPLSFDFTLTLKIPGEYNLYNALAATTACLADGFEPQLVSSALAQFASTKRRFEIWGERKQVLYIDDYAHHPDEIEAVIKATKEWFPGRRLVVAFQPHTYTRTISLFQEFVQSFATADQLVMIDIFPSARESASLADEISSGQLCQNIDRQFPHLQTRNLHTISALAEWCDQNLQPHDILLCLGAGDIYHFWELMTLD